MKPFNLKRKSWHYKCATFANSNFKYVSEVDLCSYMPAVLLGAIILSIVWSIAIAAAYIVLRSGGDLLAWVVFVCINGYTDISEIGSVDLASIIVFFGFFGVLFLCMKFSIDWIPQFKEYLEKERESENPSFLGMALNTLKDKACFKIKFD